MADRVRVIVQPGHVLRWEINRPDLVLREKFVAGEEVDILERTAATLIERGVVKLKATQSPTRNGRGG